MSDRGTYIGPPYEFTSSVKNLKALPRFGHGNDFTAVFSTNPADQADYAAGLVALFVFLLMFFMFWTIAIATFKVMGPANAGFLSGYRFRVPDPADDPQHLGKRPLRVRIVFLIASGFLMVSTFVFVAKGLTNANNAGATMEKSLEMTSELVEKAEGIATNLDLVGRKSIEIRDAAVAELDNICPANPNIANTAGMDIVGIAESAKTDLTMLANFIRDGLEALNKNLSLVKGFTRGAVQTTNSLEFWGWQMKLLAAGLFILPSFLAVGVGLVMLDLDFKLYQHSLTYFFMPVFTITIISCYIVCCAILPVSATSADACSGGGQVYAGPDDTVLTVFRNLRGDDTGLIFQFVGFYSQQCSPQYYPFDFLSTYLNDLDTAIESTETAVNALTDNQALLESECGREFDAVVEIVDEMNDNLRLLRRQADASLDLVKCENINSLYVNTVHEAGCTYSVDALAWIFASSLIISVSGMIMIMLRSAYYPEEYLELGKGWSTKSPTAGSKKTAASGISEKSAASKGSTNGSSDPEFGGGIGSPTGSTVASTPPGEKRRTSSPPVITPIKILQQNAEEFEVGHASEEF